MNQIGYIQFPTFLLNVVFQRDDLLRTISTVAQKFTGVASCSPEDEFDLEYGRKLAKERLLENYDQTVKKIASMLEEYLSDKYKRQNKALVNIQIH